MNPSVPDIRSFVARWKGYILTICLFSMMVNMLQLTFTFYMFAIYSNVIAAYSKTSLYSMTVAAFFALVVLAAMYYIRSKLLLTLGTVMSDRIRSFVFKETIREYAGPWKEKTYRTGLADIEHLSRFLNHPGFLGLLDLPWVPFYLAIIYFFHPLLGITATVLALTVAALGIIQERLIRVKMVEANRLLNKHTIFGMSVFRNWEAAIALGMTHGLYRHWEGQRQEIRLLQVQGSLRATFMQSIIKPLQIGIQVAIYGIGAYLSIKRLSNPGAMIAASILMGKGLSPMSQVTYSWKLFLQARDSYERLVKYLEIKKHISKPHTPLPKPKGYLEVQNVSLVVNRKALLTNVSFRLEPGEMMVVMGPSGAGKTTLCRVIIGMWHPSYGTVKTDGASIFHYNTDKENFIGYLPQDVELFPGTIAENIARMHKPDKKEIERVVSLLKLENIIEILPQGLDTLIEGEGRVRLSGGQRQRIGLARALYGAPRYLILDEPNSNLDEEGDRIIYEVLLSLKKEGKYTVIVVTHKTDLIPLADKLLLLRNGRVALFGPRDAVLAQLIQKQQTAA